MGFWSELGKLAIDVATDVLQDTNSSCAYNGINNEYVSNEDVYEDYEDGFECNITEYEYNRLKEEIAKESFTTILSMIYDDEIEEKVRRISSDIIKERMEYIINLSSSKFSNMSDEDLYDYYLEGLKKGEHAFGSYSHIVNEVVFGEVNNRLSLRLQYSLNLVELLGNAPLYQIYSVKDQPFVDECTKLNIDTTLENRKKFVTSVLEKKFKVDNEFITQFAIARDLQDEYYCVPYKFIYDNCYEEIIKEENSEYLNKLLDLILESNTKKVAEMKTVCKDAFNHLLMEKLQK